MLTDFRLWIQELLYDWLKTSKPTIVAEANWNLAEFATYTSANPKDVNIRGNYCQFSITPNAGNNFNRVFVRFNEPTAPVYTVSGKRTFAIPFYRLWIYADASTIGGGLRIRYYRNCLDFGTGDISVNPAGLNANIEMYHDSHQVKLYTVATGATETIVPAVGATSTPAFISGFRIYNDSAVDVNLINFGGTDTYPLFAGQEQVYNFSRPWRWVPVSWAGTWGGKALQVVNPGAVTVNIRVVWHFLWQSDIQPE